MRNIQNKILSILKKTKAIIVDDHIVGTSGRHMDIYINPDNLLPFTHEVSKLGEIFAEKFKNKKIDVVVGPAIGGIVISQWVAFHLSRLCGKYILGLFTEKDADKNQVFERGFDKLVKGKNVLVVEDITTTGGSVKKAADTVAKAGGKVVAVSVIVNRDPKKATSKTIGYKFLPLTVILASSFTEDECPMCKKNIPVNIEIAHGKEYMSRKSNNRRN